MNASPMTDIHDIAGLVQSPWPDRIFILLVVVATLVAVALVALGIKLWRRRTLKVVTRLSPLTRAKHGLHSLQTAEAMPADQFYWRLTDVFKRYVTDALQIDWLDKTREEIRRSAKDFAKHCQDEAQCAALLQLIDRSEQIKFAQGNALPDDKNRDLQLVEGFVDNHAQKQAAEAAYAQNRQNIK